MHACMHSRVARQDRQLRSEPGLFILLFQLPGSHHQSCELDPPASQVMHGREEEDGLFWFPAEYGPPDRAK